MRFRADRAVFAPAAADAARAVAPKSATPVMSMIKVEAFPEGRVDLTGFDYDTGVQASFDAAVSEPGIVLVPGRMLTRFVSDMPPGDIAVALEGTRLALAGKSVRYGMPTGHAADYPALPKTPPPVGTIDAVRLAEAVGNVSVCARDVPGLPWENLLQIIAGPDELELYATDRYTVGRSALPWSGPADTITTEVRAKTLHDLVKNLSGDVTVHLDASTVTALSTQTRTVTLRQYDVEYPQCKKIMETLPEPVAHLTMNAETLSDAMTRAATVLGGYPGHVQLHPTPDGLTYELHSEEESDVAGELEHLGLVGTPTNDLYVNPRWMVDALRAFGGGQVDLAWPTGFKALLVSSPDDEYTQHVVMPVRPPR